jgi:DNA-binding NarL/FixJ family response regulator
MLKIFVIDDHPLVCEGIKAILDNEDSMEMAGSASNGQEAVQFFAHMKPDIALVDLRLPGDNGIEIVKKLRPLAPDCRFIILTTYAEPDDVRLAMEAGVDGYILKEALPEEMTSALRLVGRGRPYFDPSVMQMMLQQPKRSDDNLSDLTDRELEVLRALTHGLSNREIAGSLFVTEHTVKKHISSILCKLDLKDRTQAALYAVSNGV